MMRIFGKIYTGSLPVLRCRGWQAITTSQLRLGRPEPATALEHREEERGGVGRERDEEDDLARLYPLPNVLTAGGTPERVGGDDHGFGRGGGDPRLQSRA
jgi:hypothetical protein